MNIEIPAIEGATSQPLGRIDIVEATHRVHAYCSSTTSGWTVYDLAAEAPRPTGAFDSVTPWAMNWGNLLNDNVSIKNIADFNLEHRREFAWLVAQVPADKDLKRMDSAEIEAGVIETQSKPQKRIML